MNKTLFFCFAHCRISKLGSGSDFEAYFIRLGIAAGRARYTKNKVRLQLAFLNKRMAKLQTVTFCLCNYIQN